MQLFPIFKRPNSTLRKAAPPVEISEVQGPSQDFAAELLKRRKLEKTSNSAYYDCRFLVPSSNIAERLFSKTGDAYSAKRQRLLPINLEMQIFLHVNQGLWTKETLQAVWNK